MKRRLMLWVLAFLPLPCVGCSELQVRGDWVPRMTADTAKALPVYIATTMPADDAREYLATAADTLHGYRQAATVNPFAFLFGDKTILLSPRMYRLIEHYAVQAVEMNKRAGTATPDELFVWAKILADDVINVNHWRLGKARK